MKNKHLNYSIPCIIFIGVYLLSILNMGNPLVFGGKILPVSMHIVFIIIFIYSFLSILIDRSIKKRLLLGYLIFFICTLPSVIFSEYIDVSTLKFLSFFLSLFSLLFITNNIYASSGKNKKNVYIGYRNINRIAILLSVFIYIIGLGYTVNETGFAGILNHPQAFGVFLVLIIITELYGIQNNINNIRWSICAIFIAFIFSLMTESRLSIISIVILLTIYVFLYLRLKITHIFLLLTSVALSLMNITKIQSTVTNIITKSGRSSTSGFEALEESRGFLVSASLNNFKDNPIFGIGFQISNGKYGSYNMSIVRESIFGLPIEALIEKGVFWSALLEETGIVGFFGFLIFILLYYKKLPKKIGLVILIAFILIGVGESFFFSLGGIGALAWCVFFMFYAVGDLKYKENKTN